MGKYQVKATIETIRKVYNVETIIEINLEGLSPYGLRCIVYGMLYQDIQNKTKTEIFVKIKDLEIKAI